MTKSALTRSALTGLLAAGALGLSLTAHGADTHKKDVATVEGECHGVNSCKGKGDCGGKGHSCAGKNSCKGQGWVKMTKEKCEEAHGKFKEDKSGKAG